MCTVSMIMDHYNDRWRVPSKIGPVFVPANPITQDEIDEFRRLLDRAREYDKRHNEPDCELDEKKERLRQLVKEQGFEIEFK